MAVPARGEKFTTELRQRLISIEHKLDVVSQRITGAHAVAPAEPGIPGIPGCINDAVPHARPGIPGTPGGMHEAPQQQARRVSRPGIPRMPGCMNESAWKPHAPPTTGLETISIPKPTENEFEDSPRTENSEVDRSTVYSGRPAWEDSAYDARDAARSSANSSAPRRPSGKSTRKSVSWVHKGNSGLLEAQESCFVRCLGSVGLFNCALRCVTYITDMDAPRSRDIVNSVPFELFSSLVIFVNAFFIGYSASWSLHSNAYHVEAPAYLDQVQLGFSCAFIVEVLVRLLAERVHFFTGNDNKWNFLDSLLGAVALMDIIAQAGSMLAANFTRILRMCRFLRLVRITRVIKKFKTMRLVVFAILSSLSSMFWSFVMIGFIMYLFAVVLMYAIAEYFGESGLQDDDDVGLNLLSMYGGIYKSCVALFMAISGGDDWGTFMKPLSEVHPAFGPVFVGYIFFMYCGVLNVVIGTFVAHSAEVASRDKDEMVKIETKQIQEYSRLVKQFFVEADIDKNGSLSWEEFEVHMQDKQVKAFFQVLQMDVSQAHHLFELLDADGSNSVTVDEFLKGCLRLKGQARNIDMNIMMLKNEKLTDMLREYMRQNELHFKTVRQGMQNMGIGSQPRAPNTSDGRPGTATLW